MDSNYSVEMRSLRELLRDRGLETHGRVQRYIDSEVVRLSKPLIPMQQGVLSSSAESSTFGSGEVTYNTPYARYHYYGKVMVGRAPKRVTSTDLKHHGAPQRGPKWFERMKATHLRSILQGAANMAGGRAE